MVIEDSHLRVDVLRAFPNPQQAVWIALHQCYCEDPVTSEAELSKVPSEVESGESIIKHLLAGNRGHFSPCEHVQIMFAVSGFPHSVIQQITRHRVGVSFSVQSNRYTGKRRFIAVADGSESADSVFYVRPAGHYVDRQGASYFYSPAQRQEDLNWCVLACGRYKQRIDEGVSEEHARGLLPTDVRQHFVMGCNARSLMHVLDLRAKADAQLEIQQLCELLMTHFREWMPQVAEWYEKNRLGKARLAP